MVICALIPFRAFYMGGKPEALMFYNTFLNSSGLSTDADGNVYFHSYLYKPQVSYPLKYADRLEFDPNKRITFDAILIDPKDTVDRVWFKASGAPNSEPFTANRYMLLKRLDEVWYEVYGVNSGGQVQDAYFRPNKSLYQSCHLVSQARLRDYKSHTLPSGRYYLYIETDYPTESNGQKTGYGAAMIEIELTNLDGETPRFTGTVAQEDFPKYSVRVLGETLHHDPYAQKQDAD